MIKHHMNLSNTYKYILAAYAAVAFLGGFSSTAFAYTPANALNKYQRKYLLLIYNPTLPNGQKTITYFNWGNPDTLSAQFEDDIRTVSHGLVDYVQAERVEIDGFPVKSDGFVYTPSEYVACVNSSNHAADCHSPDIINYRTMLSNNDICTKLNNGEIDEVWMWGGPWFGFYETNQAGTGAHWTNGPVVTGTTCGRVLNIFGFNYERGISEMIEDMGHRVEGTINFAYGGNTSSWALFKRYNKVNPGLAACGNVHFAPNSNADYDWSNPSTVTSNCKDWRDNYPNLLGISETVTCTTWNCDGYTYKKLWLSSIPHAFGIAPDGRSANWWDYVVNIDNTATPLAAAGHYVSSPPSQVKVVLTSDWSTNLNQTEQSGQVSVGVANNSYRIATFEATLDANLDWSDASAGSNGITAFFHYPGGFSSLPGSSGTSFTLYVPDLGGNRVLICPSASALGEVTTNCAGGYYLTTANGNVQKVIENGVAYWKVTGMTGTGGMDGGTGQTYSAPVFSDISMVITLLLTIFGGIKIIQQHTTLTRK